MLAAPTPPVRFLSPHAWEFLVLAFFALKWAAIVAPYIYTWYRVYELRGRPKPNKEMDRWVLAGLVYGVLVAAAGALGWLG